MEERGICVRTACSAGLAEEAGGAYKDIDLVVGATELAGISRRVVRLVPIGNVKGMSARYRFRGDVAIADVAFEAWGATLEELFVAAADATANTMAENLEAIEDRQRRAIRLEERSADLLLFRLLEELIFLKDAEGLLLRVPAVRIDRRDGAWSWKPRPAASRSTRAAPPPGRREGRDPAPPAGGADGARLGGVRRARHLSASRRGWRTGAETGGRNLTRWLTEIY